MVAVVAMQTTFSHSENAETNAHVVSEYIAIMSIIIATCL